jgi:hypothetical protein
MSYRVLAERCNECLYGPNAVVDSRRRREIIKDLYDEDGWFCCHKASLVGRDVVRCRGDFDARQGARCDRLAKALGLKPEFIKESDL